MTNLIYTDALSWALQILFLFWIQTQHHCTASSCITPHNKAGLCVNIKQCDDLMWLLLNKKNEQKAINFLRDSHCGYEGNKPKVCCKLQRSSILRPKSPFDFKECGRSQSFSEITDKIIGGEDVHAGEYPWMASLAYRKNEAKSKTEWLCGGTLISEKYIITAAHCVVGISPWQLYKVRLGDINLNDTVKDDASPVDMYIDSVIPHNKYSASPIMNDIALIKLKQTVYFTTYIKPICLPTNAEFRKDILENQSGYVAGWGKTSLFGSFSSKLLDLKIPILNIDVCKRSYYRRPGSHIDNNNLCAGFLSGEKDSCQGDSGGPLMWLNETESKYYIVGVVSYGVKCAERGIPGVYTRVSEYYEWISSMVH